MLDKPIYLDYMATTPIDPQVIKKMIEYMGPEGAFGNPASSTHIYGKAAAMAVDEAREQVAQLLGATFEDIIFTSGATESNNLAIFGAAHFYQRKGKHLITMQTEHKSVLDVFYQLEREGFQVTYLAPQADGLLDLQTLEAALTPETILVSVMQVNNETGVIQDIQAIGELLRSKGIVFHVDAAQSAGKLPINLHTLPVDLMSVSAHKNYGPKGIGALYVRNKPRIRLKPQIYGGGHENGLRSGTLATHQIAGMGEAFALSGLLQAEEQKRLLAYRQQIWEGISHLPGICLYGHSVCRVAGNLNIGFKGLEGDSMRLALQELAISSKSACSSTSAEPSYVLSAMGIADDLARSAIRLSLGRFTTQEQVQRIIAVFCTQIPKLLEMSVKC